MDFWEGEIVLWVHDGIEEMVEIVSGPDANDFFVVHREGQPDFPLARAALKRVHPELEVAEALPNLAVGTVSEWVQIINQISKNIAIGQQILGQIAADVQAGLRQPNSKMEAVERESLASLLQQIEQHRKSLIRAMRRDAGL